METGQTGKLGIAYASAVMDMPEIDMKRANDQREPKTQN
jgi:hypothetical protein